MSESLSCLFVSDLHGKEDRYDLLFEQVSSQCPDGVFIGGDILPGACARTGGACEFLDGLERRIIASKRKCKETRFFVIMGNDDPRTHESRLAEIGRAGTIDYVHQRAAVFGDLNVVGYSFVPPSPFLLKDWERYDVSRYVGVGAVSPEEGMRTVDIAPEDARFSTIDRDLRDLAGLSDPRRTIYLFHGPPSDTCLDRVANDGKFIDHAPLDLHVGSVAMRRFIEREKPFLTLHGHIHESVSITGRWTEILGDTHMFGGAHDGPGLALVKFSTDALDKATREIILR